MALVNNNQLQPLITPTNGLSICPAPSNAVPGVFVIKRTNYAVALKPLIESTSQL